MPLAACEGLAEVNIFLKIEGEGRGEEQCEDFFSRSERIGGGAQRFERLENLPHLFCRPFPCPMLSSVHRAS